MVALHIKDKGKWSAKIMILKSYTDHECPTVSLDVQHQTGKYLIQHLYNFNNDIFLKYS